MIRRLVLYTCYFLAFALLAGFTACVQDGASASSDEEDKGEYFYLSFTADSLLNREEVRATVMGTPVENQVQTLTLMIFDHKTDEKIVFSGQDNPYTVNVVSPTPSQWQDNDPNTRTLKLKIPAHVAGKVDFYLFANLPPAKRAALSGVREAFDLNELKLDYTFSTINPNISGEGIPMVGKLITPSVVNNSISIPLSRAFCKVNIVLHFAYDELAKNENFVYEYKDFFSNVNLYALLSAGPIDSLPNNKLKTPERFDRVQDTVTLGPFYTLPYNLVADVSKPSPYVLFDFLARRPITKGSDLPTGWLPPPAGGEYDDKGYVERHHFYRLIMPRKMVANTHYVIHAYFVGEGAFDAQGAKPVSPMMYVVEWNAGTLAPIKIY